MIRTAFTEKDAAYYDRLYAEGYRTDHGHSLYPAVLEFLVRMESPSVLEVGCGNGTLAARIVARGIPYRGFDLSPRAVDLCWQNCPEGEFWIADAYDPANYRPRDYNVVLALGLLEHIDDLRALRNIPASVHVLFSVPDFVGPSHLRIYRDPQADIIDRFAGLLRIGQIQPHRIAASDGSHRTIYLVHGVAGSDPDASAL